LLQSLYAIPRTGEQGGTRLWHIRRKDCSNFVSTASDDVLITLVGSILLEYDLVEHVVSCEVLFCACFSQGWSLGGAMHAVIRDSMTM
jgi:hypothetical protein